MAKKSAFKCENCSFLVGIYKNTCFFYENIDFCIQNDISPPKKGKKAFFKEKLIFSFDGHLFCKNKQNLLKKI